MNLRKFFFQGLEHIQVPREREVRMEAGDNMKFTHAFFGASGFLQNIVDAHLVCAGFAFAPAERTEFAAVYADVRWIDVHVLHEMHTIPILPSGDVGGHTPEGEKVVRLEELDTIFAGQTFVGENFFFDAVYDHIVIFCGLDRQELFSVQNLSVYHRHNTGFRFPDQVGIDVPGIFLR